MKTLIATALLSIVLGTTANAAPVKALAFDFDDTVMYTTAKIYLYEKSTGKELAVSTEDFSEVGEVVGKPGPFEGYEIRGPDATGSFREFRDGDDNLNFRRTIEDTLKLSEEKWQGPSWSLFKESMQSEESARWVYIVTSRGQTPESIHAGFVLLKDRGLIANVPPVENIFAVTSPEWKKLGISSEAAKVVAMQKILMQMDDVRGDDVGLMEFRDDDFQNVEKARTGLLELRDNHAGIQIYADYVGRVHPNTPPFRIDINALPKTAHP